MKLGIITPAVMRQIEDRFDEVNLPLDVHLIDADFGLNFYLWRKCLCVWNGEISFLEPKQNFAVLPPEFFLE